jgi:hypothetical protein
VDLDAYTSALCERLGAVAGARLVGAWLTGSHAFGDAEPGRSDVDVQAIVAGRLERDELLRIATLLDEAALPCPARGLELVVYAREDLTDPDGPAFQLNLNSGPRMARHVGLDPRAEPRFWFTLDVSIVRQVGLALTGPPAAQAFPEPPRALVLAAAGEAIRWYAEHDGGGAAALAACRTLAWLVDGRWRSKRASVAAARALLAGADGG